MTISEMMTREPAVCREDTPIQQVARVMLGRDVGSVVVVDGEMRPVGVVTDRDLALRAVAAGLPGSEPAERVMSNPPVSVADDATAVDAARQMAVRGCRRLPVVDRSNGQLVGIVTLDDILVAAGDALEQVIRLLNAERHEHADLAGVLRRRQVA